MALPPVPTAPVITEGAAKSVTMSQGGIVIPFSLTLNAIDPNGDARLTDYENALLGCVGKQHKKVKAAVLPSVPPDVVAFGYLLLEMATGMPCKQSIPTQAAFDALPADLQVHARTPPPDSRHAPAAISIARLHRVEGKKIATTNIFSKITTTFLPLPPTPPTTPRPAGARAGAAAHLSRQAHWQGDQGGECTELVEITERSAVCRCRAAADCRRAFCI